VAAANRRRVDDARSDGKSTRHAFTGDERNRVDDDDTTVSKTVDLRSELSSSGGFHE
jgi:hypothetical protein